METANVKLTQNTNRRIANNIRTISHFLLILILITACMIQTTPASLLAAEKADASAAIKSSFTDVPSTDANAIYINFLNNHGIISGYPDGTFHPNEGLSRAQAATIMVKAAGLAVDPSVESTFSDVGQDHWARAYIAAAEKARYLKGVGDGSYHPEETLSRAQAISLILRLSQQDMSQAKLPNGLTDIDEKHWAAQSVAVGLSSGMVGTSADGKQYLPDAAFSRISLAHALGVLLTSDPALYATSLEGTLKVREGIVKIQTGNQSEIQAKNIITVKAGDIIKTGDNSSAELNCPDGSSILIQENTQINIVESKGRKYIKNDGSEGIAVEWLDINLKQGTLLGGLATRHEGGNTEIKKSGQINKHRLLASLKSIGLLAEEESEDLPWYAANEEKKVKIQVDMPWGIAGVRGTFFHVTVAPGGQSTVSCLTGNAEVNGKTGNTVVLEAGKSTGLGQEGIASQAAQMSEQDKQAFAKVQEWVINTALQMDVNKEAAPPPVVEMIIQTPDMPVTEQQQAKQIENTVDIVVNALINSGIHINEEVKSSLEKQLQNIQQELEQTTIENLQNQSTQQSNQINETTLSQEYTSSSVAYINYAAAGTYGPDTQAETQTVAKNIIVSSRDITLQNMIITKDLILGAEIGDGSVTLKNVNVQGNTTILGGGPNSVTIEDSELNTVTVDNQNYTVRIVAKGSSSFGVVTLNSGAKLEESNLTGAGFSSVTTGSSIPTGATIVLIGNFSAVNIDVPNLDIQVQSGSIEQINITPSAAGTSLTLALGVSVSTLQINAQANIGGAGQVLSAVINSSGVVLTQVPVNWQIAGGITSTIGDQSRTGSGNASDNNDDNITSPRLGSLSLSDSYGTAIDLNPFFNPETTSYSTSVGYEVSSITVNAMAADTQGQISINGAAANVSTVSAYISLSEGGNTITVRVEAEDGVTTKDYTVTVTREYAPVEPPVTPPSPPPQIPAQIEDIEISGISVSPQALATGGTAQVNVSTTPSGVSFSFTSSNTSIATVNQLTGLVTGVSPGIATITATASKDGYNSTSRTINVTVYDPGASGGDVGLRISPASYPAGGVNEVIPVEVKVDDAINLYALEMHISFDPQALAVVNQSGQEVSSVQAGDIFASLNNYPVQNYVDQTGGKIHFAISCLGQVEGQTGSCTVCRFYLKTKSETSSTLVIYKNILMTKQGGSIVQISPSTGSCLINF